MLERKLSGSFAAWHRSEDRKTFLERLRRRREHRQRKRLPAWMLRVSGWMPDAAGIGKSWVGRALGKSLMRRECWSFKPHHAALGMAIGMAVAWTPTIGVQMFITAALCCLFGANIPLGVVLSWSSNPIFYAAATYVGYIVLGMGWPRFPADAGLVDIVQLAFKEGFFPMCVGSVVLGVPAGVLTYFSAYGFIHWQRRHHFMATLRERSALKRERWKRKAEELRSSRADNRLRRHARSVAHKAAKNAARASSAIHAQPPLSSEGG
jgi:uncharacterized protein (DUF2062 family)